MCAGGNFGFEGTASTDRGLRCARVASSPGIVVTRVKTHGVPVALQPLLKVLIGKVLMPCQGVGICEGGVQLQSPLEKFECILMLLQHQAVLWPSCPLSLAATTLLIKGRYATTREVPAQRCNFCNHNPRAGVVPCCKVRGSN